MLFSWELENLNWLQFPQMHNFGLTLALMLPVPSHSVPCQHKKHRLEASQLIAPLGLTLCFLCCDYCKQRSKRWTSVVVHEPFRVFGPCPVVQRFPSTPGSSALQVPSVFTWPSCQYHSLFLHQMSVIDACSLNLRVHRFPSP